jgi:hypothetical protein
MTKHKQTLTRIHLVALWMIGLVSIAITGQTLNAASDTTHVTVYFEKGRYGGWPATHGIWSWDNEILVGFTSGVYEDRGSRHHIATDKPVRHMQARSLDGGETWSIEDPNAKNQLLPEGQSLHGTELPGIPLPTWQGSPANIGFKHPDFALALKLNHNHIGPSRFYLSYDRGHEWTGPFRVPPMNGLEIAARTDYLVNSSSECLLFLTAAKANHREGRPFTAKISESGKQWEFVSWIGNEPQGFSIMPSTVRTGPEELYTTVRHQDDHQKGLRAYRSTDNGLTWKREKDPVTNTGAGNPPSLVVLPNNDLALTYGVREAPFRICAKTSSDRGKSWSSEHVIRDDGSSTDVGYPRSSVRPDGRVVTVYYFSDAPTGPERYIAASIWSPDSISSN